MIERTLPRTLLAAYAVVVIVALVVAASTSTAAFGAFNPAWDGASGLQAEAEAVGTEPEVVTSTSAYGERPADDTVALVLAPSEPYGETDAEKVRQFVEGGGTLVVADDVDGPANELLASVGADARIDGTPLRDEHRNYRSAGLPVADGVGDDRRVADVDELTLNHGTAVEPNGAEVLVNTSEFAYLDENRNEELDDDEELGPHPVATAEEVGQGEVVVLGDPSLTINVMLERPGNRAFVQALFGGHEYALLDYSHAERLPPLAATVLTIRRSAPLQLLVGFAAVVGIAARSRGGSMRSHVPDVLMRRRSRDVRPEGAREDSLIRYASEKYPSWDEQRVRRLVRTARPEVDPDEPDP